MVFLHDFLIYCYILTNDVQQIINKTINRSYCEVETRYMKDAVRVGIIYSCIDLLIIVLNYSINYIDINLIRTVINNIKIRST